MTTATTTTCAAPMIVALPGAPKTLDETGLSVDLIVQLALKTLHFAGELTGSALGERLGLHYNAIQPAVDLLKSVRQIEIVGGSLLGGASFRYRITDSGRTRAALFLEQNRYVGLAPVPLAQYQAYMRAFTRDAPHSATRERVRRAFSHLVVSDQILDQLGPAINAGRSLFIYGPPGNGKTVMAQAIRNLLEGEIAVPHAIEVEGHIVRVFDRINHEPVPIDERRGAFDGGSGHDARWIPCRRPLVTVGGELTLEQMQLNPSPAGFYRAPLQAIANGGVLVIDDFGRQRCSPSELLNRWIVPLESRVDYLSLETGQMFELPFAALVVFATNLRPSELVDEAFLRRIHAKVFALGPSAGEFGQIFEICCAARGLAYDPALVSYLFDSFYRPRQVPLRGCHPRDLIDHALSLADYRGEPRELTAELLDHACAVYFVDDRPVAQPVL
jgi:predicted ATPase with chaperone activity